MKLIFEIESDYDEHDPVLFLIKHHIIEFLEKQHDIAWSCDEE